MMKINNFYLVAALVVAMILSALPASAEWRVWTQEDEMDGSSMRGAASSWTQPTKRLRGLGSGLELVAGFTCRENDQPRRPPSLYFRFNNSPRLMNGDGMYVELVDNRLVARIKFDNMQPKRLPLWMGKSGLVVLLDEPVRSADWLRLVKESDSLLIEFRKRQGPVLFRVSLAGASAALSEAGCVQSTGGARG